MNFSSRIKIVPKGSIQLIVNSFQPKALERNAQITPSTSPMRILKCSGSFFIFCTDYSAACLWAKSASSLPSVEATTTDTEASPVILTIVRIISSILSGAIINVGLNVLLIPILQADGAAIATVLSYVATTMFLPLCVPRLRQITLEIFRSYLAVPGRLVGYARLLGEGR